MREPEGHLIEVGQAIGTPQVELSARAGATGCRARGRALCGRSGRVQGLGLLVVEVDLDARRQAVGVECPHAPGVEVQLDTASRSSSPGANPDQDLMTGEPEVDRLQCLLLKRVWLHPGTDPVGALDGWL